MTTVAWDGKTLAVDSQITTGQIRRRGRKMFVITDGSIMAGSGTFTQVLLMKDWLDSDRVDKPPARLNDAHAIWINKDGAFYVDENLRPMPIEENRGAIGSGAEIAQAALDMGLTAVEAVKLACRRDIHSGLPVVAATLKDGILKREPKPKKTKEPGA